MDTEVSRENPVRVGLIGGTGPEGRGLALRWAMAGARVTVGSRLVDRAQVTAAELNRILGEDRIVPGGNHTAISESEIVLLTVPFNHAASTLEAHAGDFDENSILIDTTVPVTFEAGRARYVELPEGSASEHLRKRLPEAIPLVAAFKTIPAHLLEDPNEPLDCDDFVASDSGDAKKRVIEAMSTMSGLRPIDAGALESARTIERMTVLAIGINRRNKIKTARFRVAGL